MFRLKQLAAMCLATAAVAVAQAVPAANAAEEVYLQWSAAQADAIGRSTNENGKVGHGWDSRGLKTERAINFKIRATWFTPEMIRASARYTQIRNRLSDDETRALVREAENAGHTVILVEIDPNEGSGVIPSDWEAFLQPQGASSNSSQGVRGVDTPDLRKLQACRESRRETTITTVSGSSFRFCSPMASRSSQTPLRKPNLWFESGTKKGK